MELMKCAQTRGTGNHKTPMDLKADFAVNDQLIGLFWINQKVIRFRVSILDSKLDNLQKNQWVSFLFMQQSPKVIANYIMIY